MQWILETLKRKQRKLISLTKMLFEDMERKENDELEVDAQIGRLVEDLYSLKKAIDIQVDKKQNIICERTEIVKRHDKASIELLKIMKEIEKIESFTTKEVVNK